MDLARAKSTQESSEVGSYRNTKKKGDEGNMPTYIVLVKFTQKGMENIMDSPNRLEAAKKLGKSLGGEITAAYYTMGQYDMVVIMEAPSNEAALKGLLITGSLGNVQTETLVAIPAEQHIEIMGITFPVSTL
jgi:uncharacterized protein with GYD domain